MTAVPDPSYANFSGRIGARFAVDADGRQVELILEAAKELPGSPRPAGGFRLEFLGPADPMIGQGIFAFAIEAERYEIFIVPIALDANGARYEAVFY